MSDYWFYLSYSPTDHDSNLSRFVIDLTDEIRRFAGLSLNVPAEDIGFFDQDNIEVGDTWDHALIQALQHSHVMLCLFSRSYFRSEQCGKELQVFRWRIEEFMKRSPKKTAPPPLIIPLIWRPPHSFYKAIPKTLTDIQFSYDDFPEAYRSEGLRTLVALRSSNYQAEYILFLQRMAERIVEVAEKSRLEPLEDLPPLEEVESAFVDAGDRPIISGARKSDEDNHERIDARESLPVAPSATVASSSHRLKAFLCQSSADKPAVRQMYERLRGEGIEPWLDVKNILPGQDWNLEIRRAVRDSHVVIVCISNRSVTKAGYLQKEIKFVLDRADEQPEGTTFLIPVKLEECEVPERMSRWHWVNFFEEDGYELLMRSLRYRARQLGLERHLVSNQGGEGNFVEALRHTLVDRVEAGDPLINKSEVEALAAAHGLNEIQASQIFRSLEGKLWRGSIIKISDEPVPRDWVAVNDLEVLY